MGGASHFAVAGSAASGTAAEGRERMRADGGDHGAPGGAEETGETAALDTLLRGERAAVAATVALACGATTYADRGRLERIGGELVVLCCALRERLDMAGLAVPPGAGPESGAMLATESYDARLAALGDFLDHAAERATLALAAEDEDAYVRTLRDLITLHAEAAEWLRERAAAFAASRPPDEPWDTDVIADAPQHSPETTAAGADAEPARGDSAADDDATP